MFYEIFKFRARRLDKKRRTKQAVKVGGQQLRLVEGKPLVTLFYRGRDVLIITVHGGGFLYNSVYDEDAYCSYINVKTGYAVASLDYSLTYDEKFPVQLYECKKQIEELLSEPSLKGVKVVLAGHSAGANLVVSLILSGIKADSVILNYPALDMYKRGRERKRYLFTLTDRMLDDFAAMYEPDRENRKNPLVSPLFAEVEELKKMPPTYVVVASGDKLAEDGVNFFNRLREAGVPAELKQATMRHGFIEDGIKVLPKKNGMTDYALGITDAAIQFVKENI